MIQCQVTLGQFIKGRVIDIQSGLPLHKVHVVNQTNKRLAVTSLKGEFNLYAQIGDTITFSSIGYEKQSLIVSSASYLKELLIPLEQLTKVLRGVTVIGEQISIRRKKRQAILLPGFEPKDKVRTIKPGNIVLGNSLAQDPDLMPSFGLNLTLDGPITYLSREEKEKRKLRKLDKPYKVESLIRKACKLNQQEIMSAYNLSEEEYSSIVEDFIRHYKSITTNKDKVPTLSEVTSLMIHYVNTKQTSEE